MAITLHDNIRLDTNLTGQLPTNQYSVSVEGLLNPDYVPIATRRGLTGKLHVHRTMDGADPLYLRDYNYELILTRAEYNTLRLEVGKIMYFAPHLRDDADETAERRVVVFQSMSDAPPFDPNLTYYRCSINLVDAEGNTVD